ncbi:hypothetical protein IVB34_34430 [Bradyrhizobium sp. 2]|uniref:hypothetical protein n=1 Tax=unclassified Bradyrhizobium TaxID=2631580 RepID=UPI001FF93449|nr:MULTISPECIES: hypothetical protein [unclassified Bradyrhizobium]MCK1447750.1 hypothetical protein [Bradyrhizobium sp. 48]MCK1463319.1 hypothetical protein [Bradyrhizobium sp. 2]
MNRRFPRTWQTVDEVYREYKQRQQELDEVLHTSTRRKQRLEAQPQTPEQPPRKRKAGGGRGPKFKPEQQAALQRERDRFTKKNPGKFKYEVMEHLQLWAKKQFKLPARPSPGTIRKSLF